VLAFLKRRWISLSFAVVLVAFSVTDLWRGYSEPFYYAGCGIHTGHFRCFRRDFRFSGGDPSDEEMEKFYASREFYEEMSRSSFGFHAPTLGLGRLPSFIPTGSNSFSLHIPLWLPLSIALGWIFIREWRWREKRAKAADQAENLAV
jgi:hypothetical protein